VLIRRWNEGIFLGGVFVMIYWGYRQCYNEIPNVLKRIMISYIWVTPTPPFTLDLLELTAVAPVPQFSSLPPISKASMVKPILPAEVNSPSPRPLFTSLISYAIRQSIALYNERKQTLINKQLIPEWEAITAQEHALLRELGLPGSLQAVEVSLGLPPSLLTHMDDVRGKGGITKLKQMRADVRNLCDSDKEIYEQAAESLRAEAKEDDGFRTKYGTQRWIREGSSEAAKALREQGDRLGAFLKKAEDSDGMVRSKLLEWEDIITLLSGDKVTILRGMD